MKKLIIHFILVLISVLTVSAQGGTRAKDYVPLRLRL